jgi:phosphoribosyl 1,2-cyclic phosphodiesterase
MAAPPFVGATTQMVKVCVLASSSSGNCTFISSERTRILVDAGLSRKETFARLSAIGEDPQSINAILVTHEHSDHVSGLVTLAKALNIPIYLSNLTAPTIAWGEFQPKIELFQSGTCFPVGDIDVASFTIPHDAIDPCGFCLTTQGLKISVATDLGYITDSIKVHLRGTDLMLLESNHDLEMLKVGPYPWSVKQRVMGRKGHLSNDIASDFVKREMDTCISTLILGHLSENNNHPEIVRLVASQALNGRELFTRLVVAEPGKPTEAFVY